MKGYLVAYRDRDGELLTTGVVKRFDSHSEMSAKTLALRKLDLGFTDVQICEVEYTPIYKIQNAPPGIGENCRMVKL